MFVLDVNLISVWLQLGGAAASPAGRTITASATDPKAGASLEEFLRTWVEAEGLSIGKARSGIDTYCNTLRAADLISKQDSKDITSWGGIRNHAVHGEWDEVSDRGRIRLMLEGVNLFMRQKEG